MGTDTQHAEQVVLAVWSELLGIENAPADADFFALGGDSLLLVRFAGRLRSELARQVAPHELLARPTPAGMTAVVLAADLLEPEEGESDLVVRAASAAAGAHPTPTNETEAETETEAKTETETPTATATATKTATPTTTTTESHHAEALAGIDASGIRTLIQADPQPAETVAGAGPLPTGAWLFAVRLTDAIDQDTLAEALTWVARRHRSLRTSFAADGEARVAPARTIECPLEVTTAGPDTAAERLTGPIDRGTAPLLRAVLTVSAPTVSTLTVAIDRAVCGAAAIPAFLADLQTVCGLVSEGAYAELAEEQPDFAPDPDLRGVELEWVRAV